MVGKIPKRKEREGVDRMGRIPLHYVALEGTVDAIEAQLAAGAPIDAQDDNGMTPLMFAVQQSRTQAVELLLNRGADPELADRHENTPLKRAVGATPAHASMVVALLRAGADPDRQNSYGKSPRDLAELMGLKLF